MLELTGQFEVAKEGYEGLLATMLAFFNSRYLVVHKKFSDELSERSEENWEFFREKDPDPLGWIADERESFYESPNTPQMLRITVHDTDQSEEILKFLENEIGAPNIRGNTGTLFWEVRPV